MARGVLHAGGDIDSRCCKLTHSGEKVDGVGCRGKQWCTNMENKKFGDLVIIH